MNSNPTQEHGHYERQQRLPELKLAPTGTTDRKVLEKLVAERFERQYAARVSHFLPVMLGLRTGDRYAAVAGLRPAGGEDLFLEQYLDRLAEQEISRVFRTPVDRAQLVEIGNLVTAEAGAGYLMFACLVPLLRAAGFRWVMCTATPQVERMLQKMGFEPLRICAADPDRLEEGATDWGRYYQTRPNVIAGDLRGTSQAIDWNLLPEPFRRELHKLAADLRQIRKSAS